MFDNKIIYIPGGSSGIGLAAARKLAEKGAHVFIFARNPSRLETALKEISAFKIRNNQKFGAKPLDVCDPFKVAEVMNDAVKEFGRPDILINTAGRSEPRKFDEIGYEQFDRILKANLYGTRNTISALLPHMIGNAGHIVNTSSVAGLIGVFGYTDYCASKFAVIGFSEALRMELKPRSIAVSVLCPPDTDTPMLREENKIKPEETKAISGNTKILSADEVARDLLKGIIKQKFMIIPGFESKIIDKLRRWCPSVLMYSMDNTIRKVQKARKKA